MKIYLCLPLIASLLALQSCATRSTPSDYISQVPDTLHFWISGFGGRTTYNITQDGYILAFSQEDVSDGKAIKAFRIKYTDWTRFQAVVSNLKVKEWRSEYRYEMDDGWGWALKVCSNGKVYSSQGYSAGPNPNNPSLILYGLDGKRSAEFILADALGSLYRSSQKAQQGAAANP